MLSKLEGPSEYGVRRPLVLTGTNLLGLVKHLATVEWGHFGAAFGQPFVESLPGVDDAADPNADCTWPTRTPSSIPCPWMPPATGRRAEAFDDHPDAECSSQAAMGSPRKDSAETCPDAEQGGRAGGQQ